MHRGDCRQQAGQSSVEYALVLFAFMASVVALCALWRAASGGGLLGLAVRHASHTFDGSLSIGLMQDVMAY